MTAMPFRCVLDESLPPTLAAADGCCARALARLDGLGDDRDRFALELLLREALTNAVRHAVRPAGADQMRCTIEAGPSSVRIIVDDEGVGFDWRTALETDADPEADHGRGLTILKTYSSALHFNDRGSIVTIVRELHPRRPA